MADTEPIFEARAPVVSAHAPNVRLLVTRGPGSGQSILLRRAASIIGSGPSSKVRLKHADVSGAHAVIVNDGEQIFVRDLVSRSGTFLNDLRAEHERIEDDDVLRVGPWHLQVSILPPASGDMGDFTGLGLDPTPTAIALEDPETREVLKLPREVSLVGRRPGCDYIIEDRSVSRAHCIIFSYVSHVVLFEMGSRNGVRLNQRPATFASVNDGDVITFGSIDRRVKLIDSMVKIKTSGNGQRTRPSGGSSAETYTDRIDLGSAELER